MEFTKKDIEHFATLARMKMTEGEIEEFRADSKSILGYIDRLSEVDVSNVDAYRLTPRGEGEWREDVPVSCSEEVLKSIISQFPQTEGHLLKTPAVFEHPKGEKK